MRTTLATVVGVLALLLRADAAPPQPIALHPENQRYFLWRGKPTVLIGISEKYGSIINVDFDYRTFLDTIAADRANVTRVMSGVLVEGGPGGRYTLDPFPGRYLAPWSRSRQPGYASGGNKFDLRRPSPEYFARLRDFVAEAGRRGIVVQYMLFSPLWDPDHWDHSPFNPDNNVNRIPVTQDGIYTLDRHRGLLPIQEALVRRVVAELRPYDNVIYELSYARSPKLMSAAWERHMTDVLVAAQRRLGDGKLISLNLSGAPTDRNVDRRVSLLNHLYADPSVIADHGSERRAVGLGEVGREVASDAAVRMRGWDWVLAGGGLYNQVNLGFRVNDARGTRLPPRTPDFACGPVSRRQLRSLVEFMEGLDFVHMRPAPELLAAPPPQGLTARVLAHADGARFALYARTEMAPRTITVRWSGRILPQHSEEHTLSLRGEGGARLWLDGRLLIDQWRQHRMDDDAARVRLEAGRAHELRLEFLMSSHGKVKLSWQSAHQPLEVVPAERLTTPAGEPGGVQAEYFVGPAFDGRRVQRKDAAIDWMLTQSPFIPGPYTGRFTARLALPAGRYRVDWVAPATATVVATHTGDHKGGALALEAPSFSEDIAARIDAAH